MTRSITRRTMLAGSAASLLAAPWVARAQANTLKIGMQSILSGPIALLGTSSRNALMMEQDRINAAGGFLGRQIEFVFRDSKGQPQEAARVARELVNSTGCELLIDPKRPPPPLRSRKSCATSATLPASTPTARPRR